MARSSMMAVDPEFHKIVKVKASLQGCSIIDLTGKMGKDLKKELEGNKREGKDFGFKF